MGKIEYKKSGSLFTILIAVTITLTGFSYFNSNSNDHMASIAGQEYYNNWTYIQIDSTRAKWGDWNQPEWLRYFGLDMKDVTGNGYKDIVAGRYFYRNPGGDMTAVWHRTDLGM